MIESRGGGSRLQQALAGLPPHAQEELLAELDAMLACSGGLPEDYPEIVEAYLAGQWPPPEEFLHSLLDADEPATAEPAPAAGEELSLAGLRASTVTDGRGRVGLSAALSDDQMLSWVRQVTAVEQQAQWLRSVGVSALRQRWSVTDTDAVVKGQDDPARSRRMRRTQRRNEPAVRPRLGDQPDRPDDDFMNFRVDPAVLGEGFAVTETALVNGVSERTAGGWLDAGSALVDGRLPHLGDALRIGRVDWAKVKVIACKLEGRDPSVVKRVEAAILPQILLPDPVTGQGPAPTIRTIPALRERLHSLLLILDPDTEDQTRKREREDRRVFTRSLSPHTAEVVAVLPIEQVAAIAARLDAAVAQAHRDRDPRPADHVRADLLHDLLTGGHLPCHLPAPTTAPAETDAAGVAGVETDAAPTDQQPSDVQGDHPEPTRRAPQTRDQPVSPEAPEEPEGHDEPEQRDCTCRHAGAAPGPVGVNLTLLIPLATLLGLTNNDPAYLDRYGPIAADLARDLARDLAQDLAANGTFRCAATSDEHGTILGLGRGTHTASYQPGTRLRDLIQTTWPRCSFPGCTTRARRTASPTGPTGTSKHAATCDLDHTQPWPSGPTCSCNLAPLCRRHHVQKTHGKIVVESSTDPGDPPGTLRWRLPSGRAYTTSPPRLIMEKTRSTSKPARDQSPPPPTPDPDHDKSPPF